MRRLGGSWGRGSLREVSCCRPAFTVAAACRDVEAVRGDGEGESPRRAVACSLVVVAFDEDMFRVKDAGEDGGSELRSGAMEIPLGGRRGPSRRFILDWWWQHCVNLVGACQTAN